MSFRSDLYDSYGTYSGGRTVYGSRQLTVSSPPQSFIEPITLSDIKSYLKLPMRSPADSEEDATLSGFISAAREVAEVFQQRQLIRKQFDMSFDYWPSWFIELATPLVSVELFQYRNNDGTVVQMVENTDYVVDTVKSPGVVLAPYNTMWPSFTPWPSSAILLRFTCGFDNADPWWKETGERIKNGMRLLISGWFNQRIPFEKATGGIAEYPYAVTACLSYGAVPRVH